MRERAGTFFRRLSRAQTRSCLPPENTTRRSSPVGTAEELSGIPSLAYRHQPFGNPTQD